MERIEKRLSEFLNIDKIDNTTYIPVLTGDPLLNKKIKAEKFASRYGSNYIIVSANGNASENGAELLAAYTKLKETPLYGSFSLYGNVPVNRVVSYNGQYYKSLTNYDGSTETLQYLPSESNSDYWDLVNSYIYQDVDIAQIETDGSNSYWEYLGESYEPTGDEYDYDYNGFKSFDFDEIVYGYNTILDNIGYFKCINPIYVGEIFNGSANVGETYNDNQAEEPGTIKVFECISNVDLYLLTINNSSLFESLGNYYPYLAISTTNRYKLILTPGTYDCQLTVDTQYIDITSITGNIDVRINGISVTANDVKLNGLESYGSRFAIGDNLSLLVCEKCKSTIGRSFCVDSSDIIGSTKVVSGTFIDCVGPGNSLSHYEKAAGTFIRCSGGSFGRANEASGYFEDCIGYNTCFGGMNAGVEWASAIGKATGTFINCRQKANNHKSFGHNSSSGRFENCVSEGPAFSPLLDSSTVGSQVTLVNGTYINCVGNVGSFGGESTNQGGLGLFTGLAINCIGGIGSFGGTRSGAGISGTLINCVLRSSNKLNNKNGGFNTNVVPRQVTFTSGSTSITLVKHGLKHGDKVKFVSGGEIGDSLPTNISGNTTYYVVSNVSYPTNPSNTDTFLISATDNGTPITISDAGIGNSKVKFIAIINCVDNNNNIININHGDI